MRQQKIALRKTKYELSWVYWLGAAPLIAIGVIVFLILAVEVYSEFR